MALDLTAGLGTIYADLAEAATYTPFGGSAVSCSVIVDAPDQSLDLGSLTVNAPRRVLFVRVAEVASAARRDEVAVGGETLTVQKASKDEDGTIWRLECSR